MGQSQSASQSAHRLTPEQLSSRLAQRFAVKCFSPLELTHFKDNFVSLADDTDGLRFWKEDTLARFLQIPDVLEVSHILGQMASYLGAWPFSALAPAILTREALCKIVVLMTERYEKVLHGGRRDRSRLLYRSLAVFDRRMSALARPSEDVLQVPHGREDTNNNIAAEEIRSHASGFPVDEPGYDEEDEDDDQIASAALEALDVMSQQHDKPSRISTAQIPVDNFRKLIVLLLVIMPLEPQQNLASLAEGTTEVRLQEFQRIADSILWSFAPEQNPGISYDIWNRIIPVSLPYMFDGLNPLFEHFLFSRNIDLSRRKQATHAASPSQSSVPPASLTREPILVEEGEILNQATLIQLSFFIPSDSLFRRLRLLYSGVSAGFSISSFEQKVLNWRAPSILLVAGTRLATHTERARARVFNENLPPKRFPDSASGNRTGDRLVYGALLNVPWKQTPKEAIGDADSLIFQLEPIHDVFRASSMNHDYATFTKSGIGFGCPPSRAKRVSGLSSTAVLGAVSLALDANLEFGVFTHDSAGGGAYSTSKARKSDWEDRFEVESLEVWGCGGDELAREQRERWNWEEKEAALRRGVNLGRDKEADYALLEMAGLVGNHGNSGGSMG